MESHFYKYFSIYKNEQLSDFFDIQLLRDFLDNFSELQKVTDFRYTNVPNIPFISIHLLFAKNKDSWSSIDTNPQKTNLVDVVCVDESGEFIGQKIATFLQWTFVEDPKN